MNRQTIKDVGRKHYGNIHRWLAYHYPKKKLCDHCSKTDCKGYDYALIHGRYYEKKRDNFLELCKRCHNIYDGNQAGKIHALRTEADRKRASRNTCKPIAKYSKDGEFIKAYQSIKSAAKQNKVLHSSIRNSISGLSKSAGGFKWVLITKTKYNEISANRKSP